jgi:hypothetical protein
LTTIGAASLPPFATTPPVRSGEYDFLGVAWPEMAAFLATHSLSSPKPEASPSEA